MPRTLHAELAQLAEKRGISLNQLIVGLLSGSVGNGGQGVASLDVLGEDARTQRRIGLALTVNLVVLVLVAAVAITLLIVAWQGGF